MKYSKKLTILLILILGLGHSVLAKPSLSDIFGRWEIDGSVEQDHIHWFSEKVYQALLGKQIEFREKYLILDGIQYNKPPYLSEVYVYRREDPRLEKFPIYDLKAQADSIFVVYFEAYAGYELLGQPFNHIIVDQDRLVINVGGMALSLKRCPALKRCPEPPFLHPLIKKDARGKHKLYIGYGHLVRPGEDFEQGLTDAQAEALLKQDIQRVAIEPLKGLIKEGSLTQNQYDAVVALVFNIGCGNLRDSKTLRLIKGFAKNHDSMTQEQLVQFEVDLRREWAGFCKGGGKVLPGLVKRRQAELDLFFGHPAP